MLVCADDDYLTETFRNGIEIAATSGDSVRAVARGQVRFGASPLLGAPDAELARLRGRRVAMIFQNPMTALNPYFTIGAQIEAVVRQHFAIDREGDADFTFHALGTAIRRCRVDFDAEIEICVDDIRPDPATGLSRSHCAVGRIRYKDNSEGTLLYIKSSLTGDEGTDIAQYRKISPAFPHESTIDQFFSESQFESYRKLGQTACRQAFAPLHRVTKANPSDPTEELRKELAEYWHGSTKDFTDHTDCLDAIWASVASDDLPECIAEIVLPRKSGTTFSQLPDDEFEQRQVVAFGQRLIQLMENVCLDLQPNAENPHPDHAGWIELFKGWVAHPIMQTLWDQSQKTYGKRFAHFWDELLCIQKSEQAQSEIPERPVKKPAAKPKRAPRRSQ